MVRWIWRNLGIHTSGSEPLRMRVSKSLEIDLTPRRPGAKAFDGQNKGAGNKHRFMANDQTRGKQRGVAIATHSANISQPAPPLALNLLFSLCPLNHARN